MYCSHCGGDTTFPSGRCNACGAKRPETIAATGVLTPIPTEAEPTRWENPGQTAAAPTINREPRASASNEGTGPLSPGQAFGSRYHIIRVLGQGGMGCVYHAWDAELGVAVAIKVVRLEVSADPTVGDELERRFKRELLLARQVTHKNVVRIHDLGEIDGIKYITMPYVQGSDLATILKKSRTLPVAATLRIAKQVAAGLQAAHEAGIVHRDLKPGNIMIEDDHALIMDFGIARSTAGGGGTIVGTLVGTLEYMAPEQARGEQVDHRADIYAFGLILYDMLIGRASHQGENAVSELVGRMQQAPPSPRTINPDIPEEIDRIVTRCLAPDARERYQTTAELARALESLDTGGHLIPGSAPVSRLSDVPLPSRRTRLLQRRFGWKAVAAIALAAALLAAAPLVRDRILLRREATAPVETRQVSLAILPFRNASGDASLDWLSASMSEMVRTEVGASTHLRAVSSDRLYQILHDLKIAPDAAFDPPTLKRLAVFSNSQAIVWGQYVKFGNEIRFDATLQNVSTGRAVPLKATAVNEAALLEAVSQLAKAVREGLALAPDVIKQLQASAFKPSSRSIQALRYYNEGVVLLRQGNPSEALKKFETATAEDADFALAYSKLAQTYASLGHDDDADRFSRRAAELSEALPAREKYLIQAIHARILNNTKEAVAAYENLAKVAPDDLEVQFDLAALYDATGRFNEARDRYAMILERDPNYVSGLIAMGNVELKAGNPEASLEHLNRALTIAIQLENDEGRANALHSIGAAYRDLNKPQDALRHYQESLVIKRRIGQKGSIAATLNRIAQVENRLRNSDAALKSYTEALSLRREIGDKVGLGTTLIDFGVFYSARGQYDKALALYKEALQIQREIGNENYEAACLNNIGSVYTNTAHYEDALTYFQQALQLREKSKNPRDIAQSLHNLGDTYWKLGHYDRALDHFLRALEFRRTAGDKRGAAIDAYSIGLVQEDQGRYAAAVSSKGEAARSFRELQDRTMWLAESLSGYGSVLAQVGRDEEARANLEEALRVARELNHPGLIAQTLNFEADRAYYRGDLAAARKLVDEALQVAQKGADEIQQLKARLGQARLQVQEGRAAAAVSALRKVAREADRLGMKYVAVESSVWLGEALLKARDYPEARRQLDAAVGQADRLQLRMLQAKSRYLLASVLQRTGDRSGALRQHEAALRMLQEVRKDAASDGERLMGRADVRPMLTAPAS
jgi:eukaryotic-like serine/threonine-protein kinase